MDKECGNDRITPRHDLNSLNSQNYNWCEQARAPTTEEGVVRIVVVSRAIRKLRPTDVVELQ
jgi:hypothetical protein